MKFRTHLFLDFDQTLFNHWAFARWMDDFFVKRHDIVPGSFKNGFDDHHNDLADGSRLYLHARHISQATGRSWSYISGEIEQACRVLKLDFCYPEVHSVLKEIHSSYPDLRILTFGDGEYQRFKIDSCRLLRESFMPVHVVSEPKASFLQREFPAESGILVDDKYPLSLPQHWKHIWITRNEKLDKPVWKEQGVVQIADMSNLAVALEFFQ